MERNITVTAVVLRSRRWGDLNRRLTLITPELGVIEALAYGARKGKLAGRIEVFLHGRFYLYHNPVRGDYSIVDVEPLDMADHIRGDLGCMYAASFMSELVMKMDGGDFSAMYALLSETLRLLDEGGKEVLDRLIIQFIWQMIGISGLAPDLLVCPICDRIYTEDEMLDFNIAIHAPCCSACSDVDVQSREMALGSGARRYLVYTSGMPIADAVQVTLNTVASTRIKRYMLKYASITAGGDLKTLAVNLL